jgi:hypothetical protein
MSDLKYEPVNPLSRDELDTRLASDEPAVVADALYRAAKWEEDFIWVQRLCISVATAPANVSTRLDYERICTDRSVQKVTYSARRENR